MLLANVSRAKLFEKWKYRNINGRAALVEKYRFEKLKWFFEKLKKTNAIPWYMFSEYLTWLCAFVLVSLFVHYAHQKFSNGISFHLFQCPFISLSLSNRGYTFVDERFRSLKRRDALVQSGPVLPLPSHSRKIASTKRASNLFAASFGSLTFLPLPGH